MLLKTDELLEQARIRTGLNDFGEDSFREPLARLVDSINRECQPTEMGAMVIPEMLIGQLAVRLEVEDWYKRHPEIDEVQIVAPLFTASLPRTGTTALGFILWQDPNTRVLRQWEAYHPCPPPEAATADTDPRIALAQQESDGLEGMVPKLAKLLPRAVTGPHECFVIKSYAFCSYGYDALLHVPTYIDWFVHSREAQLIGYRYHRRVLKLLQWHCPPNRWSLRTPEHLFAMDVIDEIYPDAQFIMTHRDPVKALPSVCSLIYELRRAHVTNPEPREDGKKQQEYWALALERAMKFRDQIGESRFFDISHRRQVANPAEQIPLLYKKLGWKYDDAMTERILRWQETYPKRDHSVPPEFFDLNPEEIKKRYKPYSDRFAQFL